MAYTQALGATADCASQLQSANLSTKAAREQSVTAAAECTATGYCATYGIPPGVCGPAAKAVAGEAIKIWNSIFGDDSAQQAALLRRKQAAAYFAALNQMLDLDNQMAADLAAATAGLINYHDQLMPSRKGKYGGKQPYTQQMQTWSQAYGKQAITIQGYADDAPMRAQLVSYGLVRETQYLSAAEQQAGWVQAPKLLPRVLYNAESYAQAKVAADQAACKQAAGTSSNQAQYYQLCVQSKPKLVEYQTQYAKSLVGIADQFYDSLTVAQLKLRAQIAADSIPVKIAVEAAAKQQTQALTANTQTTLMVLGIGAVSLTGLAAVLWIRRRR